MTYTYLLRNVSLFAQISDDELDGLASNLILQTFRKNQIIFQQGSTTSSLYIVKTGQVRVTTLGHDAEVTFTALYGPEQYFGEFSLLDGLPRSGEAVALTTSDLLVLSRPAFFRFLEHSPSVAVKLLVAISRRLRFAASAVEKMVAVGAEQQVALTLMEIAERYGTGEPSCVRLNMRLSGDEIASLAGVTRDTANAITGYLKAQGVLQFDRAHIVSIDALRLRALLEAADTGAAATRPDASC